LKAHIASVAPRSRPQALYLGVMASVLAVGLALRARGYLFDRHAFWMDEATWAMLLLKSPLEELLIRPPGFMAVAKVLTSTLGVYDAFFRAQAWLAGLGSLCLAPVLARQLFRRPAPRLLFVAVIALHPAAIDLSKEFKPYSVSLFLHMALLSLALRYRDTERLRDLAATLVFAALGLLWSQDLVMAYPGLFLVLGWDALRRHPWRLAGIVATAGLIVGLLVLQYVFIWSKISPNESAFWGRKYDVFYTHHNPESRLAWWFQTAADTAAFPGFRRTSWDATWLSPVRVEALRRIDTAVWFVLHLAGVISLLIGRRWREAVLLLTPFVTLTLLNALGFWPAGAFRTNLFLVVYTAAVASNSLDGESLRVIRWQAVVPSLVLVVLPFVLLDRSWNARKTVDSNDTDLPAVLRQLTKVEPPRRAHRVPLFIGGRVCAAYDYYTRYHARHDRFRAPIEHRYEPICVHHAKDLRRAVRTALATSDHAWWISDLTAPEFAAVEAAFPGLAFDVKSHTLPDKLVEVTTREETQHSAL
jgi:hypothetical protein